MQDKVRVPSLLDALLPLLFLILALFASVSFYGEDSSYGPNQIALLLTGCLALLIGMKNGHRWGDLERGVYDGMAVVFAPSFILLAVGLMIATWIVGGIVPSMIYYALQLMNPSIFYAATCLICAVISLSIGSSWTTAASVGVALIGTAAGLGLSPEITAGAIISGAYFGDKMSPLSDTTNLAPAVTHVDLFEHIRHMFWTGLPALAVALALFLVIGLAGTTPPPSPQLAAILASLEAGFTINVFMLLPLAVLLILAWKKVPALPAILIAALLGGIFAALFQPGVLRQAAGAGAGGGLALLRGLWSAGVSGHESALGNAVLDELLSGGGAANMLNTIWLILSAVFFGGAMERTGLLQTLISAILRGVRGTASMITATVFTGIGANIITGDQYIAIVLPGRMYSNAYRDMQLAPVNLSRAIEDSATVTSALVPWNTCGAFMAATLGVATLSYLPFCFFNLAMPLISIAYGLTGFRIMPLSRASAGPAAPAGFHGQ